MTIAADAPPSRSYFTRTFREAIRVGFNWDRFFAEEWPIELVSVDAHPELGRCYMPWYVGAEGNEVAYHDPTAVPISLSDVPKNMPIFNEERRVDIQQYSDSFRHQTGLIKFEAPTYALPDNRYFILDRNHRLAALTLNSVPFEVTLWNVRGPLDPICLLDLIHWVPFRRT